MTKLHGMRKWIVFSLGIMAAGLLSACNSTQSKTDSAMELLQNLEYKAALAEFDAAEEAGENERLIARGRGIAYMGLTDYDSAIANFEEALRSSDGFVQNVDFDINYYLAAAYIKKGELLEAESAYNAILALRPNEQEAYFLRGSVRLERGQFEPAKEDFDKVVSLAPKNYDRLIEIYKALEHFGYKEVGQDYLRSAMESAGSKMDSYDSGRMHYYLGNFQEACLELEKSRSNGNAESFLYLGKAYEATGDYNYAASVYNSYLSKDTGNAEIYNQLGMCQMAVKSYREALNSFQAGKKLGDPAMTQSLAFNEIVAYEYLGEYKQAGILINLYVNSYPDDEVAQREKQFLATR